MRRESSDALLAEVRACGFRTDFDLLRRIQDALDEALRGEDHLEIGRLHIVKTLALQGYGDHAVLAETAAAAVPHLVTGGDRIGAASAAAMAAVSTAQVDDLPAAMDHAVVALVLLDDVETIDQDAVRALTALTGLFRRLTAFESAVRLSERAFDLARQLQDGPIDTVAHSLGTIAIDAARSTGDPTARTAHLERVRNAADWLATSGTTGVSVGLLAPGLEAEISLVTGRVPERRDLDAGERHYADAVPELRAWHRMVRGCAAVAEGEMETAIDLLDAAIAGFEQCPDQHWYVRATEARAAAFAGTGDDERAYLEMRRLAATTRRWQIEQASQLAGQVIQRADLERSQTMLRATAEQLAVDVDIDATTGVRSRHWLERRLDQLTSMPGDGHVLMFDLDHFKAINDTFGHHVGDEVLRRFGILVNTALEGSAELARFGGEEFVAVRVDSPDDDEPSGEELAEQIRLSVALHDWGSIASGLDVTVSCGVIHGALADARDLLVVADDALFTAKHRGRNQVATASPATPPATV